MLKLTEFTQTDDTVDDVLTLPFEARQKSRQPAVTNGGVTVGLFLPRGQTLRNGLVLTGSQGFKVRVEAAAEELSVVYCQEPLLFARACYHLGNRHIALQILPNELRYLADHVLDQMLIGLGLTVHHLTLAFEPESGAYHAH
ncbi:urease accessory protein UreE [Methylomonas paludis]|uniref:Urease accessory protein UreE n=1 Tax=Methylomonas paludis TaxID=1173101 RepID=A0A975MLG9_9GAMM|nr:urease accessory protein UreE [Methylomonas paludis]QWF70000.1 urease accessory protein UreE [Methylomonas paludis]